MLTSSNALKARVMPKAQNVRAVNERARGRRTSGGRSRIASDRARYVVPYLKDMPSGGGAERRGERGWANGNGRRVGVIAIERVD